MAETRDEHTPVVRTVAGLVLILGAAPAYYALIEGQEGWTVILGGLAALGVLIAGIVLAGRWLGVFQRRKENPREQQQGCLALFVTLLALLAVAAIIYYIVYYGAGAFLRGELAVLLP